MRLADFIQIGFASLLAAASWVWPLPARRRVNVTLLGVLLVCAIAISQSMGRLFPPNLAGIVHDWLTAALFLIPYWQTGQFFLKPSRKAERVLIDFDRRLFPRLAFKPWVPSPWFNWLIEVSYLFCYPLVPLGLAALYAAGLRREAGNFWVIVLTATYLCYALTSFVPAYPPRVAAPGQIVATAPSSGRVLNHWILRHGSIHAISFPSAHVASALSVALVLLQLMPAMGAPFMVVAILIALAAVAGRYHYALDVILGAVTALVIFLTATWLRHHAT